MIETLAEEVGELGKIVTDLSFVPSAMFFVVILKDGTVITANRITKKVEVQLPKS